MRLGIVILGLAVLVGCAGSDPIADAAAQAAASPTPEPTSIAMPEASPDVPPQPYLPAGPVGNADAYDALVSELAQEIPFALRSEVPWPDLRHPDPVQAQLAIFELWIWMAATNPEPALAPVMGAPGSPSRSEIAGIFGELDASNELHSREQQPYRAFDHRVVTFATAGLPLWLARDVPDDAVVIYYKDESGPTTIRDRASGNVLDIDRSVATRQWLSIMVPTDVGWLLYRDQLIEPGNLELPLPDSADPDARTPGL